MPATTKHWGLGIEHEYRIIEHDRNDTTIDWRTSSFGLPRVPEYTGNEYGFTSTENYGREYHGRTNTIVETHEDGTVKPGYEVATLQQKDATVEKIIKNLNHFNDWSVRNARPRRRGNQIRHNPFANWAGQPGEAHSASYHISMSLPQEEDANRETTTKQLMGFLKQVQWLEPLILSTYGTPKEGSLGDGGSHSEGSDRNSRYGYAYPGSVDLTQFRTYIDWKQTEQQRRSTHFTRNRPYRTQTRVEGITRNDEKGMDVQCRGGTVFGVEMRFCDSFGSEHLEGLVRTLVLTAANAVDRNTGNTTADAPQKEEWNTAMARILEEGSNAYLPKEYIQSIRNNFKLTAYSDLPREKKSTRAYDVFTNIVEELYEKNKDKETYTLMTQEQTKPKIQNINESAWNYFFRQKLRNSGETREKLYKTLFEVAYVQEDMARERLTPKAFIRLLKDNLGVGWSSEDHRDIVDFMENRGLFQVIRNEDGSVREIVPCYTTKTLRSKLIPAIDDIDFYHDKTEGVLPTADEIVEARELLNTRNQQPEPLNYVPTEPPRATTSTPATRISEAADDRSTQKFWEGDFIELTAAGRQWFRDPRRTQNIRDLIEPINTQYMRVEEPIPRQTRREIRAQGLFRQRRRNTVMYHIAILSTDPTGKEVVMHRLMLPQHFIRHSVEARYTQGTKVGLNRRGQQWLRDTYENTGTPLPPMLRVDMIARVDGSGVRSSTNIRSIGLEFSSVETSRFENIETRIYRLTNQDETINIPASFLVSVDQSLNLTLITPTTTTPTPTTTTEETPQQGVYGVNTPQVQAFIDSIAAVPFLRPDGNPKTEWKIFYADSWTAARDAAGSAAGSAAWTAAGSAAREVAWTEAWTAARDAARDAAGSAAWDAAWTEARETAGSAAWDAAWTEARETAGSAAWDARLMVCLLVVSDLDYPNKQQHTEHSNKRWEVWQKGYALLCELDGELYVYAKRTELTPVFHVGDHVEITDLDRLNQIRGSVGLEPLEGEHGWVIIDTDTINLAPAVIRDFERAGYPARALVRIQDTRTSLKFFVPQELLRLQTPPREEIVPYQEGAYVRVNADGMRWLNSIGFPERGMHTLQILERSSESIRGYNRYDMLRVTEDTPIYDVIEVDSVERARHRFPHTILSPAEAPTVIPTPEPTPTTPPAPQEATATPTLFTRGQNVKLPTGGRNLGRIGTIVDILEDGRCTVRVKKPFDAYPGWHNEPVIAELIRLLPATRTDFANYNKISNLRQGKNIKLNAQVSGVRSGSIGQVVGLSHEGDLMSMRVHATFQGEQITFDALQEINNWKHTEEATSTAPVETPEEPTPTPSRFSEGDFVRVTTTNEVGGVIDLYEEDGEIIVGLLRIYEDPNNQIQEETRLNTHFTIEQQSTLEEITSEQFQEEQNRLREAIRQHNEDLQTTVPTEEGFEVGDYLKDTGDSYGWVSSRDGDEIKVAWLGIHVDPTTRESSVNTTTLIDTLLDRGRGQGFTKVTRAEYYQEIRELEMEVTRRNTRLLASRTPTYLYNVQDKVRVRISYQGVADRIGEITARSIVPNTNTPAYRVQIRRLSTDTGGATNFYTVNLSEGEILPSNTEDLAYYKQVCTLRRDNHIVTTRRMTIGGVDIPEDTVMKVTRIQAADNFEDIGIQVLYRGRQTPLIVGDPDVKGGWKITTRPLTRTGRTTRAPTTPTRPQEGERSPDGRIYTDNIRLVFSNSQRYALREKAGQPGWFRQPRKHSEARKKGLENKLKDLYKRLTK